MNTRSLFTAVVLLSVTLRGAVAQDFGTSRWVGSSSAAWQRPALPRDWRDGERADYRGNYGPSCSSAHCRVQPTTYPVTPALTTGYAPIAYRPGVANGYSAPLLVGQVPTPFDPYRNVAYPPSAVGSRCQPSAVPYGYGYSPAPLAAQLPRGYYRADGFYGQDAVFAQGQPIRNFFRKLLP